MTRVDTETILYRQCPLRREGEEGDERFRVVGGVEVGRIATVVRNHDSGPSITPKK